MCSEQRKGPGLSCCSQDRPSESDVPGKRCFLPARTKLPQTVHDERSGELLSIDSR